MTELIYDSPSHLVDLARTQFKEHPDVHPNYRSWRGLRNRTTGRAFIEGYVDVLPTFGGKNLIQLVNEGIQRNQGNRITVVDIGYGQGHFLLDAREEWGDDIDLIGYGTDFYSKHNVIHPANPEVGHSPTYEALKTAGVSLIEGDPLDIRRVIGDNRADFILSSYALLYSRYPFWEMIKKIYRVLKPDGTGLLDIGPNYVDSSPRQKLKEELATLGYNFEFGTSQHIHTSTAFQKTQPDINIPLGTIRGVQPEVPHRFEF